MPANHTKRLEQHLPTTAALKLGNEVDEGVEPLPAAELNEQGQEENEHDRATGSDRRGAYCIAGQRR